MWRFPNPKEATQWLRMNAQGPTGFYLWGSIYAKRTIWDGSTWHWLTEQEQKPDVPEPVLAPPPIAGEADREYRSRIDAERCTLQFRHDIAPTRPVESHEDLPLFGGDRQGSLL